MNYTPMSTIELETVELALMQAKVTAEYHKDEQLVKKIDNAIKIIQSHWNWENA